MQMIVAGFSGHTDLSRAAEISNEVRRVVKNLKECQQLAALYTSRERLFNLPVTQVSQFREFSCSNVFCWIFDAFDIWILKY